MNSLFMKSLTDLDINYLLQYLHHWPQSTESTEPLVARINSDFSNRRPETIVLMKKSFKLFSENVFQENIVFWSQMTFRTLEESTNSGQRTSAAELLLELLETTEERQTTCRHLSSQLFQSLVPPFVDILLQMEPTDAILKCLIRVTSLFGGLLASKRVSMETIETKSLGKSVLISNLSLMSTNRKNSLFEQYFNQSLEAIQNAVQSLRTGHALRHPMDAAAIIRFHAQTIACLLCGRGHKAVPVVRVLRTALSLFAISATSRSTDEMVISLLSPSFVENGFIIFEGLLITLKEDLIPFSSIINKSIVESLQMTSSPDLIQSPLRTTISRFLVKYLSICGLRSHFSADQLDAIYGYLWPSVTISDVSMDTLFWIQKTFGFRDKDLVLNNIFQLFIQKLRENQRISRKFLEFLLLFRKSETLFATTEDDIKDVCRHLLSSLPAPIFPEEEMVEVVVEEEEEEEVMIVDEIQKTEEEIQRKETPSLKRKEIFEILNNFIN